MFSAREGGSVIMQNGSERPDFEPRPLDYVEFLSWSASSLSGGGSAFAFCSVFEGDLSAADVEEAWYILCLRHPMLGATIQGPTSALQFVPLDTFPTPWIQTTSSANIVEELLAFVGEREFPPGAPLYQPFALLSPSSGRHAFLTVIHHAGGDGDAAIRLHEEFTETVRAIGTNEVTRSPINRELPPSWCKIVSSKQSPWRFFSSGAMDVLRQFHCDLVPFESYAPFKQRRTRHLIAIADTASTRSIVERASEHHGMAAFLSAGLLQAQFAHMQELGLVRDHAKLVLTIAVNLRRFAEPTNSISMGTVPYFSDVRFERNMPSRLACQRVRKVIDQLTGSDARSHVVNWYSPRLTHLSLLQLLTSKYHFGPTTTHLGRLDLDKEAKFRRVTTFDYLQMRHSINSVQADTRILNDRFVTAMTYCEPIVSHKTALKILHGFLRQIGAHLSEVTDNYDEYVDLLLRS